MTSQIALYSRDFYADPYPFYRRLREESPVHYDPRMGWLVTRYADIRALARDPRLSRGRFEVERLSGLSEDVRSAAQPAMDGLSREMMRRDPPDHTRLRRLVSRDFTSGMIERLRPRIKLIAERLLDAFHRAGRMDVIADFAYPLPALVIMEFLGLPLEDRDRLKAWTSERIAFLGSIQTASDQLALARRATASADAMNAYFGDLIAERRARPKDDLLSALIAAEDGDRLTEAEVIANCSLLLSAGHETTSNLIGNGLLALLRNRDEMRCLAEQPDLLPVAIEELLRYDTSAQLSPRAASADIEMCGVTIRSGQRVMLVLAAANRDPRQFAEPDRLDITRQPNDHLSFGFDRHFCLGSLLARLEAEVAFNALIGRYPNLQLESAELEWQFHPAYRGLKALPVAL